MLLLALNNYVVHDYTCIHDLPHLSFRPGKSEVLNNSKSSMKHTKYTLDILTARLRKPRLLSSWHGV
jgi:hypothetical protein